MATVLICEGHENNGIDDLNLSEDEDSTDSEHLSSDDESDTDNQLDESDPAVDNNSPSDTERGYVAVNEDYFENSLEIEGNSEDSLTSENVEAAEARSPAALFTSGHARGGHHRGRARRPAMAKVKMPSGRRFTVIIPNPPRWKCGTPTKLVTLSPRGRLGRKEYKIVSKEMQKTIRSHFNCGQGGGCFSHYKIVKVQKVINGCLWQRYRRRQTDIKAEAGFVNERMLFHGSAAVDDIVKTGFDERHTSINGMFGAGLYFAKHSSKSNQYTFGYMGGRGCPAHKDKNCYICTRKLLLCRVTLGRSKTFQTAHKLSHEPPGYNSVVGAPSKQPHGLKFPEYVVYRGEQAYPEYVVTYKIAK